MKRKTALGLIATLFLTTALLAQPQERLRNPEMRSHKMLDLTEEQQAKMEDLRLNFERETLPLKSQLRSLHTDLKLVMTQDKFDAGKADKLVDEMQKVRTELQKKGIRHQQDVRALLTPEQRQKFDLQLMSEKGAWDGGGCGVCGHDGPHGSGRFGPHMGGGRP